MIRIAIAAFVAVLFALPPLTLAQERGAEPAELFSTVVDGLRSGALDDIVAAFDDTMRKALPAASFEQMHEGLVAQFGALESCAPPSTTRQGAHELLRARCEFENGALDLLVVVGDGRIAGLRFMPPEVAETPPPAPTSDAYVDRDVTVGSGGWALPGTLSMPKGDGPFPSLVLVHGSGPHDRDETIGPNRPFRDLADGLAARGIAVLRYEKRSKAHGEKLAALDALTLDAETVEDAVHAVKLLRATEGIDPARVYVLGHSLGGLAAPRIARAAPEIAGLVIFAGTSRALPQVIAEQLDYLASLEQGAARDRILELKKEASRIESITAETKGLVFGAPASYWLDLAAYDPVETARTLPQRILVLQGERDYQVTLSDYIGWKRGLAEHAGAEFRSYPRLNHLFIDGAGKSVPAEYQKPGHVAVEVITDIAAFVQHDAHARTK